MGSFGSRGGLRHMVPLKDGCTLPTVTPQPEQAVEDSPAVDTPVSEPFIDLRRVYAQDEATDYKTEDLLSTHPS